MPPRRTSKKDTPKKLAGRMKRRWEDRIKMRSARRRP